MKSQTPGHVKQGKKLSLDSVKLRFDDWRLTKKPGERIPENLWDLAVDLTARYSMNEVNRTLKLGWDYFKRRILQKRGENREQMKVSKEFSKNPASFLEVKLDAPDHNMNSFTMFSPPSKTDWTFEIFKSDGSHLRLTMPMSTSSNLGINLTQICERFVMS